MRYVVTVTTPGNDTPPFVREWPGDEVRNERDAIARTEEEFVRNLPPNVHLWRTVAEAVE